MTIQVPKTGDYAIVATADAVSGTSSVVVFKVGDSLEGANPVSILGGRYKDSDAWVIDLKKRIATRRAF